MEKKKLFQTQLFIFILVCLTASFFQFFRIARVPPGLFPDEAAFAIDGLNVLKGQLTLYSENEGGAGALWRYLLAPYFALFGASIFTLRAFAGGVGVLSAGMAYLVTRELTLAPTRQPDQVSSAKRRVSLELWWPETIAFIAALLLAVSFWHVSQSRPAFPTVLMLLSQDAAFFCLWRAFRSGRRRWFLLFGFSLGLMAYAYLPGKLVPVVPLFFLLLQWLISRRRAFLITRWRSLLMSAGVAGLVALPMILFALLNIRMLVERAALPSVAVAPVSPWQGLLANLTVFGLWPASWITGPGQAFFLGPLLTLCFIVGFVTGLVRFRQPAYLFLIIWWLVMLLPGALAPEGTIPHLRRSIGAVTPTFALTALGLAMLLSASFWLVQQVALAQMSRLGARARPLPLILMLTLGLILVGWTGRETFRRYFVEWGPSEQARLDFHIYDLELADIMARESGADSVYLLPLDSSAGIINPLLDTITFVYQGRAAYDFLPDDERTLLARLSELTTGKQIVRLLTWKVTKHTGADPKAVAAYYLEKWGRRVSQESHQYFNIDTYQLYKTPNAFSPTELFPIEIDFESQLELTGYAFDSEHSPHENSVWLESAPGEQPDGPVIRAGNRLWVELTWRKIGATPADFQVGLWLEDRAGHLVVQVDKLLMGNLGHYKTSAWPMGAEERDYYLLPVDPATLPGTYRLKAILYERETARRLGPDWPEVGPDLAVILGEVTVAPPLSPVDPAALPISERLDLDLGEGLRLLGLDRGLADGLRPGDPLTLGLWWQTEQSLSQDLTLAMSLRRGQEVWPLSVADPLGGIDYPTGKWPGDTVVRTFADGRLPANIAAGEYDLAISVLNTEGTARLVEGSLGTVRVAGRSRSFEIPPITHQVGANFGREITLLGYDLDLTSVATGNPAQLTLYWQAQSELTTAYQVFVHFLDESGKIVMQVDREPQAGEAPTTSWLPDEVVADRFEVPRHENLLHVTHMAIGLYDLVSGQRLPLVNQPADQEDGAVIISVK